MSHQPPSQVRILLLLFGSMIAGTFVSSSLSDHAESRLAKPLPQSEQSLVVESP